MKLLRRRPKSFDIQVQDMVLHITASPDLAEESRAAALSFWEQLQSYVLRDPAFRESKRPIPVPADAPEIVKEMIEASANAGVGPMFTFQGAVTDQVGRFLARETHDLIVTCGGDYFVLTRRRMKLAVKRRGGAPITVVLEPDPEGVGVSTTLGRGRGEGPDGLAVIAASCMAAGAAAAGVQAILPKENGFRQALRYLEQVPGVTGGVIVSGDRLGFAGKVEVAGA
ncbi:MAG: hypothetical protein HY240_00870 [Actinobacteria bacterium]|nr:hypothetical protein [Actinomycetota bacterium]